MKLIKLYHALKKNPNKPAINSCNLEDRPKGLGSDYEGQANSRCVYNFLTDRKEMASALFPFREIMGEQ